ncbi:hypothetical protein BJP34_27105 [Moorena producens PAL-8-15-08-1]|uniref:Uncharacterized protein n=1 Tax=Moorena producens PAL-8-15-08-1 TaxID=1458985 RepID=A0A1D8TYA1_9CYAN|nr:hypothetical protein BJP34_27105 [Moorena producens PAL-8-15-08-1]
MLRNPAASIRILSNYQWGKVLYFLVLGSREQGAGSREQGAGNSELPKILDFVAHPIDNCYC